jgi:hypothetical protein
MIEGLKTEVSSLIDTCMITYAQSFGDPFHEKEIGSAAAWSLGDALIGSYGAERPG